MKINYFILFIVTISFSFNQEELVIRDYVENGSIDVLINNFNEHIYLVQLDVINDSLYNLAITAVPELELNGGPSSYHRLMHEEDLNRIRNNITSEYAQKMINRGFQFVTVGSDQRFMTSGAKSTVEKLKKVKIKKEESKAY